MSLPKIYYGSLINPESLTALSVHPRACLAVNVNGVIDWIEENVESSGLQDLLASKGLFDVDVIELKNGEFLLPGFVDTHTVGSYHSGGQRLFTDTMSPARTSIPEHRKVSTIIQSLYALLSQLLQVVNSMNSWTGLRTSRSLWKQSSVMSTSRRKLIRT